MNTILQKLTLALTLLMLHTVAQGQSVHYYKNFGPAQGFMDSLFEQVYTPAPVPFNLLYDKVIHQGFFGYCDGDANTDTLDIEELYQYYTEVIDMNTLGVAGYEQFLEINNI